MKKILLSLALIALSTSVNAQSAIDRQIIKDNANNLGDIVNDDITILYNNYSTLNEDYIPELTNIIYNKYKMLTTDLLEDELLELTNSVKEKMTLLLGEELYQEISENETVLNRITGTVYLTD